MIEFVLSGSHAGLAPAMDRTPPSRRKQETMAHVLARLRGVKLDVIENILIRDASRHAEEGLHLEHLWQNVDDADEVLFLFRVDDLRRARQFVERVHGEARKQDPDANLPVMTFLADS